MSQEQEQRFEQSLQSALKASLQNACASEGLRARLLERMATEHIAPEGIREADLQEFESALGRAVGRAQDWAPADDVVLRVESSLSSELGYDLLSERAVHAGGTGGSGKERFLTGLRASIEKSQGSLLASPQCRARIVAALAEERGRTAAPGGQVIPFKARSRWTRGLAAVASLAAGVFLVFGTLLGGAEKALADSVRLDHERCCSALQGTNLKHCASVKDAGFGPLPEAPVASGWTLVASKVCQNDKGKPMVHNVYLRSGKTMSLHFLPPQEPSRKSSQPREIANDGFPVMAWETSGWTVTACSTDLDMTTLASAVTTD